MRKILRGHVFYKNILFTLCLGFSFLTKTHAQVSGTFTINSALPTGGSNFNTFSAAAASLSGGVNGPVVFNVQAGSGPYNEQVIMNTIAGTSATNTITFNCNGVTLNFFSTDPNQRAGIKLKGTDYVTFDNLVVKSLAVSGQYGYGFHLLNDADHNTIKNCVITPFTDNSNRDSHEGIVINASDGNSTDQGDSFCDDNLIQNNTITGGTRGITLSSIPLDGNPIIFMNANKIIGNTISRFLAYGIQVFCTSNTVVDGNDISAPYTAVTTVPDVSGVYLTNINNNVSVTNNRIHGFKLGTNKKAYGIIYTSQSEAGKENLLANNLIYDFVSRGGTFAGVWLKHQLTSYVTTYVNIYNNTIVLNDQSQKAAQAYGVYMNWSRNVKVWNNILNITCSVTNWNIGLYFEKKPTNFSSKRNDIYANGTSFSGVAYYGNGTYYNVTQWYDETGYDYYSSDVDPQFTDAAAFNFIPTAQAIDNSALYVGIDKDISNAARNLVNPDPGCYEYTSPPCTTPINLGKMQIDPDSAVCKGEIAALGLRKNSAGGAQTYTWQTASSPTATFTNVSSVFTYPYYEAAPTTTGYYRVAVTCGTSTVYSSPIQIIVNAELEPGTYTINSAQPTGGINFSTFRHAVKALKCGFKGNVVFNVNNANGPYNEQVIIPDLLTSPTKTVTFNCNGAVLQFKPKRRAESAVLKLNGADYVTVDSLTVNVVDTTFGFGIQLMNNADHNTIKRCTINGNKDSTDLTFAGIVMNADSADAIDPTKPSLCDSNLITNNTVIGGYYGITCASTPATSGVSKSIGNIIRNNTIKDPYAFGIHVTAASPTLVDSNDISQPTRKVLIDFTGIMIKENTFGAIISRNKIHNILEQGKSSVYQIDGIRVENVLANSTNPNVICNNALYYFKGNGYQQGLVNASSSYLKFYHNTVSLDDTAAKPIFGVPTRGFGSFGISNEGVEFKNNIIVIRRGGAGDKYCFYMNFADSSLIANYNNYYLAPAGTGDSYMGVMGGNTYATLASWLATRKDSSSISMDPVFNDLSVGDLTPTKIPFENRGSNVGITNDIWNVTRSTTRPDIGAYEFTICKDLTTPVITVDSGGVNVLKFSWNAIQNTSGYRVSRDGVNWSVPSSGAFGTSHIVSGLKPTDTVGLMVKALGSRIDCPEYLSLRVVGRTLTDGIFIPNTFTPNGNGQNDVFKVYTNLLKSVHWMVFNQWGEKVFETTELQGTWDGNYKGKPQPVGVYVYVMVGTLADGNKVTQKGTFNLIR